jgi:hypothetical protein
VRPGPLSLALLLVVALPALPGPVAVPARGATLAESDPVYAERLATVSDWDRQAADAAARIQEIERDQAALVAYANRLGSRIEALKKGSGGIMHDAQLQDALQEARQVLARLKGLVQRRVNLATRLRTMEVILARVTAAEANRLEAQAEVAVRAGRDDAAAVRFEAAIDLLRMGAAPRPMESPATPRIPPETLPEFNLTGEEGPDDFRGVALVLRDAAEGLSRRNLALWTRERSRLEAERETLTGLIALASPGADAEPRSLQDLDARVGEVADNIERLRGDIAGLLKLAVNLERQADREEEALIQEALHMRTDRP